MLTDVGKKCKIYRRKCKCYRIKYEITEKIFRKSVKFKEKHVNFAEKGKISKKECTKLKSEVFIHMPLQHFRNLK